MKIAIDVSPLHSGHKVRGVGFYLEYLKRSLLKYFPENEYHFFTKNHEIPTDIDIVHYPYFDPFFSTLPYSRKYKTVVTVHDLTPLVFPEHFPAGIRGNLQWQMQRIKLRQVDAIITDSIASKNDIVKIVGIATDKVSVAYLAAGEEFKKLKPSDNDHRELMKKYNLPEHFVLYVGDVTWNKNVPRLIKAVQQTNLPLIIVGKALAQKEFDRSNPWNKDLALVHQLKENDTTIFTLGFIPTDDLIGLYNMASVFAFPSLYEGFGLPVIEAMQSGLPVVTTRAGSLEEVAGEAVEYVDGYDIRSIAEGINKVFHNPNLQQTLAKRGLEQSKKFSWKKTAEDTIAVYSKVLNI